MELAVRVSGAAGDAGGASPLDVDQVVFMGVLGVLALVFGIAHYRGFGKQLAETWTLSPYVILAVGWMGAAVLLVLLGVGLMWDRLPAIVHLVGGLIVAAGVGCWFLGLVGIFWLPRRLRPRWLVEQVAWDPAGMRTPHGGRRSGGRRPRRRKRSGVSGAEPAVVVDESSGVGLPLPAGWERVDVPGLPLAIAGPPTPATADGTPFRPSVNVLVAPVADGADVRALGTEALAAATLDEGAHVVGYDMWPMPDGTSGRRLDVATSHGSVPVMVRQWVILSGDDVVTVTGTLPVADLLRTNQVVEDVVVGLRLPGGAA